MMDRRDLIEAFENGEQALAREAKKSMLAFTLYTMRNYQTNWHHAYLCSKLDDFATGKIKRLMVFMPPRHGKSELASRRFPAYMFGRDPSLSIILASYAADLASRMNRDTQRIIDSRYYADVFPETFLSQSNVKTVAQGSWLRNSEIFETVGFGGTYRCAGVGGGITGMGAHRFIIDDPIKNYKEAKSKTVRDGVWEWYTSTAYSRLEDNAGLMLIQTRWHEDDLAGRLLALAAADPEADQWEVVNFPAIKDVDENPEDPRELDEALWPQKYDLGALSKIKKNSEQTWNALYQQRPSALEGNIIKKSQIQFYRELPADIRQEVHSWDAAFKDTKNSDFVVGTVWAATQGSKYYLVDAVRDRMGFSDTLQAIKTLAANYPKYQSILIEDKANGPAIIEVLKKTMSRIIAINPGKDSKASRLEAVSPLFAAGDVYFPHPDIAPWVVPLINELCTFDNGPFDDFVDSLSQALNHMDKKERSALYKMAGL